MTDLDNIVARNQAATEAGLREHARTEELLSEYSTLSRTPADRLANAKLLRAIMAELRLRFPAPRLRRAA